MTNNRINDQNSTIWILEIGIFLGQLEQLGQFNYLIKVTSPLIPLQRGTPPKRGISSFIYYKKLII